MNAKRIVTVACVALLCCMTAALAYSASNGEKVKIKGLITGRTGETLIVKTWGGEKVVVVLDDGTKVQKPKGAGLRKAQMSAAVLIPGLKISVDGVGDDQNRVVAKTISFNQGDLETAETIQAGLTPTRHQVQTNQQNIRATEKTVAANQAQAEANSAANRAAIAANQKQIEANDQEIAETTKRFSELTEYETKGDITVNFKVGSSVISQQDQAALMQLAHDAVNLTGYIVQVKGFADSSGNAAMNQKLSMARAEAVIAYLIQNCNVPVRHIVAPGAMGTADPTAPNETAQGRAENRRVEVKVLVNKGLAGQ